MVKIALQNLDLQCKKLCNQNVLFFRTDKTLKEGVDEIRKTYDGMESINVKDKSLIFNTDLVETSGI